MYARNVLGKSSHTFGPSQTLYKKKILHEAKALVLQVCISASMHRIRMECDGLAKKSELSENVSNHFMLRVKYKNIRIYFLHTNVSLS